MRDYSEGRVSVGGRAVLSALLATHGLGWLVLAVLVAGMVRGFSGFGSALVYVPVAGVFLPPAQVVATMVVFSLIGPLPLLPRAWRECARAEVLRLALGALVGVPLGVFLLTRLDGEVFRWLVSGIVLLTLGALVSGWRYTRAPASGVTLGAGFLSGALGGFVGLPGPPVILLYLGGRKAVAQIRAAILLFLFISDTLVMGVFVLRDMLSLQTVMVGLVLGAGYLVGGLIGARLFDPSRERLFRVIAYGIILVAALLGLPVFG